MNDAEAQVLDLLFGSWRSQLLSAGVQLGVFEALGRGPASADQVAGELQGEARRLYRRRKGWVISLHNVGLTCCFASYSCDEVDRRKLFSVKSVSQVFICCCPS